MKSVVGIVVLLVLALAGYRRSFKRVSSLKKHPLFLTGTEFILVGFLLGDSFLGILDPPTLQKLRPLLILGLGWIGLLSGIQLEWGALRLFARSGYGWILGYGVCFFGVMYASLFLLLRPWYRAEPLFLPAVGVLAVAALCSGQTSMALWVQNASASARSRGKILQYVSSMVDVVAILIFALLVCCVAPPEARAFAPVPVWARILFSFLFGVLIGILFVILFRTRLDEAQKVIVLIGLLLFGGGMSYLLGVSPLFVCLIAGSILGNFSLRRDQTFHLLLRIERPLYLIFLIICGAWLALGSFIPFLLALAFCILRAVALAAGGGLVLGRIARGYGLPHRFRLGWGLLSQGGVAVALAVHLHLLFAGRSGSPFVDTTFTLLLLAVLFNEFISPLGLAYAMREE